MRMKSGRRFRLDDFPRAAELPPPRSGQEILGVRPQAPKASAAPSPEVPAGKLWRGTLGSGCHSRLAGSAGQDAENQDGSAEQRVKAGELWRGWILDQGDVPGPTREPPSAPRQNW